MPNEAVWTRTFAPTRIRAEQNLQILDVKDIPFPPEFITSLPAHLLSIKPGGWGGNHRHLSREIYVALNGGLYLVWRDSTGERREVNMTPKDGKLQVFAMPPFVPHLIENRGSKEAFLYELIELNEGPLEPLEGDSSLRLIK